MYQQGKIEFFLNKVNVLLWVLHVSKDAGFILQHKLFSSLITQANKKVFFSWVYELLAHSDSILSPKYDGVLSF